MPNQLNKMGKGYFYRSKKLSFCHFLANLIKMQIPI